MVLFYRMNFSISKFTAALFKDEIGLVSPAYIVFKIDKTNLLNAQFLFSLLKSHYYLSEIKRILMSRGSVRRSLSFKDLFDFTIPLPPLHEQKKIAYVLSVVQKAEEKTDKYIQALRELKKSAMKHLFTYGAVPFEEADKVELKETEIGSIPKKWEVVRLGEVAEINSGGTPSTNKKGYWENGDIPWIKSGKCQDCYIKTPDIYITKKGLENSSAKIFKPNTILVAMVGATVGKTGLLTFSACTNQNVAGIYPKDENLYYLYVYFMLQSRYSDFTKSKGFIIANLSFIKKLLIPFSPLPEQQHIASILSGIDEQIEAMENKKKAIRELFNSLLKNLMTAKIRVNNLDLKDETVN